MEGVNFSSNDDDENFSRALLYEVDEDEAEDNSFVEGIQDVTVDSSSSSRSPSCQVITRESLLEAQMSYLRRVMDLLLVKEHHARTLLIQYKWNIERLLTVFVEKGKAHLFAEAGVIIVEHDALSSFSSLTLMCNICMEAVPCNEATQMGCGHTFCNNCWTEHFIVKINDGDSRRVRCMAYKCNAICDEDVVKSLLRKHQPELAEKFDRFLLESYIEDNKMVKWCPSIPHCGNAIRIEDDAFYEVECACGLQFCFRCLSEAHSPCSCLMWELWSKKCNESETFKWITVNAKCCPTCQKPVEKNGGCNVVHCICGSAFCWSCGKKRIAFSIHNCARYIPPEKSQRAKNYPHRQIHYYSRYKVHRDSIKLEAKLEKKIKKRVSFEQKKPDPQDFSWVKNGAYRLSRTRNILSYSYVFAFYMFGNDLFEGEMTETERSIKQNLFEDQQQQLEARVEQLSELMKQPFHTYTKERVKQIRMMVIALTCTIDDLCKKMYDCIENDLLGPLQLSTHIIAPYESKGAIQASELAIQCTKSDIHRCLPSDHGINGLVHGSAGCLTEICEPSSSGNSSEGQEPSGKRPKIGDSSSSSLGLNLPSQPSDNASRTALL